MQGPLPADTLFLRARRGDFDLVVAMYHDQGHAPVKVLGLEGGVNITVGLPVRCARRSTTAPRSTSRAPGAPTGSLRAALREAAAEERAPGIAPRRAGVLNRYVDHP